MNGVAMLILLFSVQCAVARDLPEDTSDSPSSMATGLEAVRNATGREDPEWIATLSNQLSGHDGIVASLLQIFGSRQEFDDARLVAMALIRQLTSEPDSYSELLSKTAQSRSETLKLRAACSGFLYSTASASEAPTRAVECLERLVVDRDLDCEVRIYAIQHYSVLNRDKPSNYRILFEIIADRAESVEVRSAAIEFSLLATDSDETTTAETEALFDQFGVALLQRANCTDETARLRERALSKCHLFVLRERIRGITLRDTERKATRICLAILKNSREHIRLRKTAGQFLVRLGGGGEEAVGDLVELLVNGNSALYECIIESLGEIGPAAKQALPRLRELDAKRPQEKTLRDSVKTAIERIEAR